MARKQVGASPTAAGHAATKGYVDSLEMRGTGMPEGVVTAAVGTYYTDTAGTNGAWRWLKTSGTGNTGWLVTVGDTGNRRVSLTAAGEAGFPGHTGLRMRRINSTITFSFNGGDASLDLWDAKIYDVPYGFSAPNSILAPIGASGASSGFAYLWNSWGDFPAPTKLSVTITAGNNREFFIQGMTDDQWPTTLPGVLA